MTDETSNDIALSFVIPMYNEEGIVRETVARVMRVGRSWGRPFEVLAVDDGSVDRTPQILAELCALEENMRWVQLRPNCGQPAASKAGLLAARGEMIVVLDADLQTTPEVVPSMVAALEDAGPEVSAVFGVTTTGQRDDPLRLLVGQAVFYFLETRLGRHRLPHGASSFFVMRKDVAQRLGRLTFTKGNVGAVMAALGLRVETVSYIKPKSYRDESRLGLRGHVEEAVGSLALTGVLSRLGAAGTVLGLLSWCMLRRRRRGASALALGAAAVSTAAISSAELFNWRSLQVASGELPMFEGEKASMTDISR